MFKSILVASVTLTVVATMLTISSAGKRDSQSREHHEVGPDVVAWYTGGDSFDMDLYGQQEGIVSFAFGTTFCNFGDQ